ncbi:MAG TPA: NifU family protein [Armatimonadota bacterium]|jgi:Fe-S cluster biogenesis protein NfuA|nr:NifU family protein [Armatimonadota bacterium]
MREKVQQAIDDIRVRLQADGGDIDLVDVDEQEGIVKVRLKGACVGCPMAQMTLQRGVEQVLKEQVPGVQQVVAA